MNLTLTPNRELRKVIQTNTGAESNLCWACGSCDNECPINVAANRLSPRKIVRMANYGLLDELFGEPEIWYCLTCYRCFDVCPNRVKPVEVIQFVREEALRRKIVKWDMLQNYKKLIGRFQRIRWQATNRCLNGGLDSVSEEQWYEWLDTQVELPRNKIIPKGVGDRTVHFHQATPDSNIALCLTCSECTNCCPVFYERSIFDPQATIRMVNMGLTEELLSSPSIWLCISCGRCSQACTQTVKGRELIGRLRSMAIHGGHVSPQLPYELKKVDKLIYPRLLDEIDACLGLSSGKMPTSNTP